MDVNTDETLSLNHPYHRSFSLEHLNSSGVSSRRLLRSTTVWIVFGLVGWYYPRYLIAQETTIASKPAPYQQTAAGDVILDFTLNEPVVDPPTIPSALLMYTSVWLPLLIVVAHAWLSSIRTPATRWHEVTTAISGFSMAIGLSEGTTQLLKLAIQRRRPNFYELCGFDKQLLKCTASLHNLREANFSFPSGHSSLACCAMTFLVWYFLGKSKGRRFLAFASAVIPWGWAIMVAASRLVDKWHHFADVVAGLGLGFVTCTVAYHTWYPPVWSQNSAGMPRTLLEELENNSNNKLPSFNE